MSDIHDSNQGGSCGCGCSGHGSGDQKTADLPNWRELPGDEMVCYCQGVTKSQLRQAVEMGAYTLALVKTATNAGRCARDCESENPRGRCCAADISELIRIYHQGPPEWLQKGPCCG